MNATTISTYLLCCLVWISTNTNAQTSIPSQPIDSNLSVITNFELLEYIDYGQQQSIQNVAGNLHKAKRVTSSFHHSSQDANHWLIFSLKNTGDVAVEPTISMGEAHPEVVNLYYKVGDTMTKLSSGGNVAMSLRPIKDTHAAFSVPIPAASSLTFFIETSSTKNNFSNSVEVFGKDQIATRLGTENTAFMLFFGACIALIIYNSLMFMQLRESLYFYYIGYGLSIFSFIISVSGYDLYLHSSIQLHHLLEASPMFAASFFLLFMIKALDTVKTLPRIHIWLQWNLVVDLALTLWLMLDISILYYVVIMSTAFTIFTIYVIIYAAITRVPLAAPLLFGTLALTAGMLLLQLQVIEVLPNNAFTRHAFVAGSLIELLIFSVILSIRIKITLTQNKQYQHELLTIQTLANANLEIQIQERTQELEAAVRASKKSNSAKSDFIATVNHEIRTPLSGILGMIGLLQQEVVSVKGKAYINALKVASNHLDSLVANVLDMSKVDQGQGKIDLYIERFNLIDLIDELKSMFGTVFNPTKLSIEFINNRESASWHGDYSRIRQILVNLIGNSLKYTAQGSITISFNQGEKPTDLSIQVADTGIGIPLSMIDSIFNAYQQAPIEHRGASAGTGLGLRISQSLARAMSGEISVQSQENEGSCFSLWLPNISNPAHAIHSALPIHQPEHEKPTLYLKGVHLLLVEDSEINQILIKAYLDATFVNITLCDTASAALKCYRKGGIDFILSDLHLKGTSGIDLAASVRAFEKQENWKRCPIVLQTADVRDHIKSKAITSGIDYYMPKPYSQKTLLSVIAGLINAPQVIDVSLNIEPHLVALSRKFLTHANRTLSSIGKSIENKDIALLTDELHELKGTSAQLGGNELAHTLGGMEGMLRASAPSWADLITQLDVAYMQLKSYEANQNKYHDYK